MRFDHYDCDAAAGVVLAHTIRLSGRTLKKGRVLDEEDIAELRKGGITRVSGVRLADTDVDEDDASLEVARALAGSQVEIGKPVAGRCYLYARGNGLATIDRALVDAVNLADAGVQVATLPDQAECLKLQALASIKVIPFAVDRGALNAVLDLVKTSGAIDLVPYRSHTVALILTQSPGLKLSLLEATSRVTRKRVEAMSGQVVWERRCDHEQSALEAAIDEAREAEPDLLLISGASITVDVADVVPAAITGCGGRVEHFGMPVEPGNMLLLGRIDERPVINLPGCSRSPKLNGLDWVMQRVAAGLPTGKKEVLEMGVGGLVKDISHRWRMREQEQLAAELDNPYRVAGLVLGAGRSSRMGARNKLLAEVGGVPMLQRVVDASLQADLVSTTVVTGCEAGEVRELLRGRDVKFVHNERYEEGLAGSLKAGLSSLPTEIDGVMVLLADMPFIGPSHLNELIAEFNPQTERDIVAPIREGRLGNPVIWSLRYLPAMMTLTGDRGARPLLQEFAANVWEVPMGDDAIFLDVDTPEVLAEANRMCGESS